MYPFPLKTALLLSSHLQYPVTVNTLKTSCNTQRKAVVSGKRALTPCATRDGNVKHPHFRCVRLEVYLSVYLFIILLWYFHVYCIKSNYLFIHSFIFKGNIRMNKLIKLDKSKKINKYLFINSYTNKQISKWINTYYLLTVQQFLRLMHAFKFWYRYFPVSIINSFNISY